MPPESASALLPRSFDENGRALPLTFEELQRRAALMPPSFDENGRILPLTPEQMDERRILAMQALELIGTIGDDEEHRETLAYLTRVLKEKRANLPRSEP